MALRRSTAGDATVCRSDQSAGRQQRSADRRRAPEPPPEPRRRRMRCAGGVAAGRYGRAGRRRGPAPGARPLSNYPLHERADGRAPL